MTRKNEIDDEEILRLWNEGESVNAISEAVGHTHGTVGRHLEKMEVDVCNRHVGEWTEEQDRYLIIGRNSGRTGKDLYSSVPGKSISASMHRLMILRRNGVVPR